MTEELKFEDIEIYPAEASERGTNAYHLKGCAVVGHQPSYAACLKKVRDRKSGRLSLIYSDCSAAIGKKECPAMKMQAEELKEGRAIYFINREKLQAFNQYRDEMSGRSFATSQDVRSEKKAKRASIDRSKGQPVASDAQIPAAQPSEENGFAAAINAAIQEETTKAVEPKPVVPVTSATDAAIGSMSLIEIARLKLAARENVTI